jgi:hypothetical protein
MEQKRSRNMNMNDGIRQFHVLTGSDRLRSPKYLWILLPITGISVWMITRLGIAAGIVLVTIPFLLLYFYWLFRKPAIGVYSAVILGFVLLGLARYMPPNLQLGIAMDVVLVLTYVALFFNRFNKKINWRPARKDITLLAAIWFGYSLLEFFNPEAQSRMAWLSGVRGISMYMMLMVPLVLLLIDDRRKLDTFLYIWAVFSILASVKGILQITVGVDPWEQYWLDTEGGSTHIIFGKLRAFSFMSDAGQFGANQAYSAVVATIVALAEKKRARKLFFFLVAVLGFVGMFLSGTRGAISIPLAGFMLYLLLRRNGWVLISGVILLSVVFVFFKFTYIGQSNQFIRRMRSAFNPDNPSLQVRLENQKKLSVYLASRPFGGGIGEAGVKAKAFNPDSFLSSVATDSWYVLIWAEQGIVGLILHLSILFYIIIRSSYLIMYRIRNPLLKMKMAALASGMLGVMVASYGNAVLGTMPTSLLIYTSMALMLNAKHFDDPEPVVPVEPVPIEPSSEKRNQRIR